MESAKAGVAARSHIIAKALVIGPDGTVLVLRRSPDDEDAPGRLDLPGGGIEPGESYVEAVAREIQEESGITVSVKDLTLGYAFTRYDELKNLQRIRLLYVAHVVDPAVQLSHEHDAYWWRTLDELEKLFAEISWGEGVHFLREHQLI